jgi:hypothetical protein
LEKALSIQRECLGKNHKDVGYTCSFIGTGYWKLGKRAQALQHYFEAKRIFAKHNRNTKTIDTRIQCMLFTQFGFRPEEVSHYIKALRETIEHELAADRLFCDGKHAEAKKQYVLAKQTAKVLSILMKY